MSMKKLLVFIALTLSLSSYCQDFKVTVINVGQGDAIYIECPDGEHQMLIDAGEQNHPSYGYKNGANEFRSFMTYNHASDDTIEVVVASHNHSDHIGSMDWVLNTFPVGLYVDNGKGSKSDSDIHDSGDSTAIFKRTVQAIMDNSIPWAKLTEGIPNINFCPDHPIECRILCPDGMYEQPANTNINDLSIVIRIDYKNSSFLFTGDAEKELEELLLHDPDTKKYLDVDFLKVGHHGSHSSCAEEFLNEVTPYIASISCGASTVKKASDHCHPRKVTVDKLLDYVKERDGIPAKVDIYDKHRLEDWYFETIEKALYFTSSEGDLVFVSDGDRIVKI